MRIQEAVNRVFFSFFDGYLIFPPPPLPPLLGAEHHMITQLDGLGIPVFTGYGKFEDNSKVRVEQLYKDPTKTGIVEADHFVIATGRCVCCVMFILVEFDFPSPPPLVLLELLILFLWTRRLL